MYIDTEEGMKKKIVLLISFLLVFLVACSDKGISLSDKSFVVDEGNNQGMADFSKDGYATLKSNNQESVTEYEVFTEQYQGYDGIVIDGDYYLAEQQDNVIYLWGVTDNFNINEEDDYYTKVLGNVEDFDMKLTEKEDF